MIDAKTAKNNSDNLHNSTNQANLAVIESKIVEASNKGQYSVSVGETLVSETIVSHLKGLGYKVVRNNGFYDQRDWQASTDPYYDISWS